MFWCGPNAVMACAARAINFNQRFLEKPVAKERPRLLSFIRSRVRVSEDAEAILQDVLQQLLISYDTIESLERIGAWLFQVARNRVIDRAQSAHEKAQTNPEGSPPTEDVSRLEPSAASRDLQQSVIESLESALSKRPVEQRDVYVMHEFQGLSFKEIAEQTGESMNTLLSRKRYAVKHLKIELNELFETLQAI